jgi:hypothetical protein
LRREFHGKEGVDGSSPSEGSAKAPQSGLLRSGALAWSTTCDEHGALYGAFRSRRASVRSQKRPHWARRRSFHRDVLRGMPHRAGRLRSGGRLLADSLSAQMSGMDMGGSTDLGSFALFVGTWVAMMAAMILPGAVPAALAVRRRQRSRRRVAPVRGLVPRRLGTVRARRLRPLPAARRICRGRSNNRGLRLRAHAAEARVPASLPRQRPFFRFGISASVRASD